MPSRKRFLIVGHPRTGTCYMAALFKAFGYAVNHERPGVDGVSAWSLSAFDPDPPFAKCKRTDLEGALVVHVLRDPRQAVWSIAHAYDDPKSRAYLERYSVALPGFMKIDNAAIRYVSWSKLVQAQSPDITVKVEEAPKVLEQWLGHPPCHNLPPTTVNSRPKNVAGPRPKDALALCQPTIAEWAARYFERFGYAKGKSYARIAS